MSVTVKVYLERPNTKSEIRRFPVDHSVACNFAYLCEKIHQVFPGLSKARFEIRWKDVENDFVSVSSDDELMEALGNVNDGVLRLYLSLSTPAAAADRSNGEQDVLHPHVTCDGCSGPVRGKRFKCMTCPDYDLCESCEGKGLHQEHSLLRISTPRSDWRSHFFHQQTPFGHYPPSPHGAPFGGPGAPPHGPPCGGFGAPPHGPPCGGLGAPPTRPPFCQPGGPGASPHGPAFGPPGVPPPPYHGGPAGEYPFHHMARHMMRQWKRQFGFQDCQAGQQADKKPETQETMEGTEQEKEANKPDQQPTGRKSPAEEYLRCIGSTVAAMLDPLGIDVEVDVEHKGQTRRCPPNFGGSNANSTESGHGFDTAASSADCPTSSHQGDVEMDNKETGERTVPKVEERSSPTRGDAGDSDWTMLMSDGMAGLGEAAAAAGALLGQTLQLSAEQQHNQRIEEAVAQLKTMGFGDEDGWLTRLVTSKDGDINKVLDALRPHK